MSDRITPKLKNDEFKFSQLRKGRFLLGEVMKVLEQDPSAYRKFKQTKKKLSLVKNDQVLFHLAYPKAPTHCHSPECKNQTTTYRRNGDTWGYNKYCSTKCAHQDPELNNRVRSSYHLNPKNKTVIDRIRATWKANHGSENLWDNKEVRAKRLATYKKKYGVDHPWKNKKVRAKQRKTLTKKYGGASPFCDPKVMERVKATNILRYGEDNPSKNAEVFSRIMQATRRVHKLELDGKVFNYLGYEGYALKVLHEQIGIPVKNLSTSHADMPRIVYGKRKRRYFPDIQIKGKQTTFIEVKSIWTIGSQSEKYFKDVLNKAKACAKQGLDLRVWLVFPKEKRIQRFNAFEDMTFPKLREALGLG